MTTHILGGRLRSDSELVDSKDPPWSAREVRQILGLGDDFSYQRLQRLWDFATSVVHDAGSHAARPERAWRRYTAADVARIGVLIALSGGAEGLAKSRRRIQGLEKIQLACEALRREPYGLTDPLLQVRWLRHGTTVLVVHRGDVIDPLTNQAAISLGGTWESDLHALAARHPRSGELVRAEFRYS